MVKEKYSDIPCQFYRFSVLLYLAAFWIPLTFSLKLIFDRVTFCKFRTYQKSWHPYPYHGLKWHWLWCQNAEDYFWTLWVQLVLYPRYLIIIHDMTFQGQWVNEIESWLYKGLIFLNCCNATMSICNFPTWWQVNIQLKFRCVDTVSLRVSARAIYTDLSFVPLCPGPSRNRRIVPTIVRAGHLSLHVPEIENI